MFRFLNALSKRKAYYIFHALFLGIIFTISMLIGTIRTFNNIDYDQFVIDYINEVGCEVINLEMTCDEDYYVFDSITVDLEKDGNGVIITDGVLLTRNRVISNGFNMTYEEFFETVGHDSKDFVVEDGVEIFESLIQPLLILISVFMPLLLWLGHMLFNFVRTIMNKIIVASVMGINQNYFTNYKVTMLALTPLVIFNAITRSIWGSSVVNMITNRIPGIGGLVSFMINTAIIFGITYLMLKNDNEDQEVVEIIEEKEML